MPAWRQGGISLRPPWRQPDDRVSPPWRQVICVPDVQYSTVLLVLHFITAQPNLSLTQHQVVVLLPSGVVH